MVTISTDSTDALKKYQDDTSAPFMMLSDTEKKVLKDYDLYNPSERDGVAVPAIVVIDRSGIVRYAHAQGKIIRVRNKQLLKELKNLNLKQ
jgi:peroxiredoxin